MQRSIAWIIAAALFLGATHSLAAQGRTFTVRTEYTAQDAYDNGFTEDVMRGEDDTVRLWNRRLIENDAPGSGTSNKGSFMEPVYGARRIKKILPVDDPRCDEAVVVIYFYNSTEKKPLVVELNGHTTTWTQRNTEQYAYIPVEPSWLREGDNEIVLSCPEAEDPENGWVIMIARADEYVSGGWTPGEYGMNAPAGGIGRILETDRETPDPGNQYNRIGDRSMVSTDGGSSWTVGGKGLHPPVTDIFHTGSGDDGDGVVGEYSVRLNLRRYRDTGALVSQVMDLWADPGEETPFVPFTEVERLTMNFRGSTPSGTDIEWIFRAGVTMDPLDRENWTDWIVLGSGARAEAAPLGRVALPPTKWDPERTVTLPKVRYIQWGARLRTDDPLETPVVESAAIEREITRRMEIPENMIVTSWHNPGMRWSSTGFIYQDADEPGNQIVRERDDLETLVAEADSEFDAIVKLMHYAATRWVYAGPRLEYPKWNTIDMAERAHSLGDGGMCIQHAAYLVHILTVMGFQARHVNIIAHEVVEVWSNDFDKWIYLDPTQGVDCYLYNTETGVPLDLNEMHRAYYELYGVEEPIDWMAPRTESYTRKKDYSRLPIALSTVDPRIMLRHEKNGLIMYYDLCSFLRMMPRNNFSTTAIPEPTHQGNNIQWPWDGYVNWYDELAPPTLQYSVHTDRVCDFWPTLNRVRFEAVPEVNGDAAFVRMITFTPNLESFQVRIDDGEWEDSDPNVVWRFHSGRNRLDMRVKTKFGVTGHPSHIELNWVAKPIPRAVNLGDMQQK